jgi:spore coat protein U-like protein
MKKLSLVSLVLVLTLAMAGMSFGATSTTQMVVSVTVPQVCEVSAYSLYFGEYTGSFVNANSSIGVLCPLDVPYEIALDAGQNFGQGGRNMSDGLGNMLYYELYDSSYNWWGDAGHGDTFARGNTVVGTGTGAAQYYGVTGYLYAQGVRPYGYYQDVVNVTVYY